MPAFDDRQRRRQADSDLVPVSYTHLFQIIKINAAGNIINIRRQFQPHPVQEFMRNMVGRINTVSYTHLQKAAPDSHPVPPCLKVSELSSGLNRLNQLMRCRNMPVRIQRILAETVNLMSGKQQIVVCLAVMADVKQSLMNAVSSRIADFPRRPVRPRPGRELALRQTAQTFRPVSYTHLDVYKRQRQTSADFLRKVFFPVAR